MESDLLFLILFIISSSMGLLSWVCFELYIWLHAKKEVVYVEGIVHIERSERTPLVPYSKRKNLIGNGSNSPENSLGTGFLASTSGASTASYGSTTTADRPSSNYQSLKTSSSADSFYSLGVFSSEEESSLHSQVHHSSV